MNKAKRIQTVNHLDDEQVYRDSFYVKRYAGNFPVKGDPHRHFHFQILLLTGGKGRHVIDDAYYALEGNDLFLIADGQVHCFENSEKVSGYLLCFRDNIVAHMPAGITNYKTSLFNNLQINSHFRLNDDECRELKTLFDLAIAEYVKEEYPSKWEVLGSLLKIILMKIENLKASVVNKASDNNFDLMLFQRFVEAVETKFAANHDVASFADELGVSARKLTDTCKVFSGKGAKDVIEARIITEAKRLLQFTSQPVKEIAVVLGFADQYQLSKFFKKHVKSSPVEYRSGFGAHQ